MNDSSYRIDFERSEPPDRSSTNSSLLETVGWTPMVPLEVLSEQTGCEVYAKLEQFNPGGSVKDRIAISMVRAAEKSGDLQPGGTIIESTSGNTGMGLALVAASLGYKLVITIPDKMSQEKVDMLKGMGAEVYVCPTAVEPEDSRSYYSVARRLNREIPNSFYINQYENPANPEVHYRTTGPEIYRQMDGDLDVFVCGIGTGGTISGVGRYLKEQLPSIRIVGVDPKGSLFKQYFEEGNLGEAESYQVEGIGEDMIPDTIDFTVVDDVIQLDDGTSFREARRLARTEGIFAGGSAGTAVAAVREVSPELEEESRVVVLIPDTGERYVSKFYNDEWMKENQYLPLTVHKTARDLIRERSRGPRRLLSLTPKARVADALDLIREYEVSQIPIIDEEGTVRGTVYEEAVIDVLLHEQEAESMPIQAVLQEPLPIVEGDDEIGRISRMLADEHQAVLVEEEDGTYNILTKYDLVSMLSGRET